MTDLLMKGYAAFSPCMVYRYDLIREWDSAGPTFLGIWLNPSTADAEITDPTTTKMMRRAKRDGYGRYVAVNLFAVRSPKPTFMKAHAKPVGPVNDYYIQGHVTRAINDGGVIVVGWGNDGAHLARNGEIMWMLKRRGIQPKCFHINEKTGQPKHPTHTV